MVRYVLATNVAVSNALAPCCILDVQKKGATCNHASKNMLVQCMAPFNALDKASLRHIAKFLDAPNAARFRVASRAVANAAANIPAAHFKRDAAEANETTQVILWTCLKVAQLLSRGCTFTAHGSMWRINSKDPIASEFVSPRRYRNVSIARNVEASIQIQGDPHVIREASIMAPVAPRLGLMATVKQFVNLRTSEPSVHISVSIFDPSDRSRMSLLGNVIWIPSPQHPFVHAVYSPANRALVRKNPPAVAGVTEGLREFAQVLESTR